jgi:hypothetical protein
LTTIIDRPERERLLRRLAEGDVEDEELRQAIERLRRFFIGPWAALDEVYLSPGADRSKLARWRKAQPNSDESQKAADFDRAVGMLADWLDLSSSGSQED